MGHKWYQLPAVPSLFFKGTSSFKEYKTSFSIYKNKNQLSRINVAPAPSSVYWCTKSNGFIYLSKLICGHSSLPFNSAPLSEVQNLHCPLQICSGALIQLWWGISCYDRYCSVSTSLEKYCKLAPRHRFLAAGANLIHKS